MMKKIAVLGDFNPAYYTHHAINDSISHLRHYFKNEIVFDWIGTETFDAAIAFQEKYAGLWIVPGSPYQNMQNVLDACTYTRDHQIPVVGNCGGFQHMLIEFARNVCNIVDADTQETNPDAGDLLISKLSCSLVSQEEEVCILEPSHLFSILKNKTVIGKYYCNYGLNPAYVKILEANGLVMTAFNGEGEVRAFELEGHPFYMGTLFQPALSSSTEEPNPILLSFVEKCRN